LHDAFDIALQDFVNGEEITWVDKKTGTQTSANLFFAGMMGDWMGLIDVAATNGPSSGHPCAQCLVHNNSHIDRFVRERECEKRRLEHYQELNEELKKHPDEGKERSNILKKFYRENRRPIVVSLFIEGNLFLSENCGRGLMALNFVLCAQTVFEKINARNGSSVKIDPHGPQLLTDRMHR
jgi:hypothetical protein